MAFHWSGKRVLVMGGAGFIGSHLFERLLRENAEVLCVDNYFTGRRTNIAHLLEDQPFEVLRHDICFLLYVEVDAIFNFACPASPIHYQSDPVQTTKVSVLGDIHSLAKRLKCRVLQASTSEVYGDPSVHLQPEEYWGNVNPVGPACNDETKRCAETLFFDYRRQHKLPIKVMPIFNTYRPRMHRNDGRVVSDFVVRVLKSEPITIYGDGLQTRSFCYVDDLIDGAMRLMTPPEDVTGPINIGNPREITIRERAETIIRLSGSSSKLIHLQLPKDDPKQRKPDIIRAREALGWQPTIDLEVGLRPTIDYFAHLSQSKLKAHERMVSSRTNLSDRAGTSKPIRGPSIRGASVVN
jgi:UDP-glucuronate decarboxylase